MAKWNLLSCKWPSVIAIGLIQIPIFLESEGGEAKNCLSSDAVGASFFRAPVDFKKIVGFEYSLDFLVLFYQEKRTVETED